MERNKNWKAKTIVISAIVVFSVIAMAQTVVAQPPPQPVTIEGDVVFAANGSRVPNGWIVNITDITAGVLLNTTTTKDIIPAIPQYSILVDPSLIIVGHVIEAYSESPDGTFKGTATHTVVTDDDTPGGTITMPDVSVSANAPPSVSVTTPSGTQHGDVQINYTLFDAESDICSIQVQFKGGSYPSWTDATTIGATTGLSSSADGIDHSIIWDSSADVSGQHAQFQIMITPSDAAEGESGNTSWFIVDNKAPTIAFVEEDIIPGIPGTPGNGTEVNVSTVDIWIGTKDADVSAVTLDWNGTLSPMDYQSDYMGYHLYNTTKTSLPNGLYTYKVYANDTVGNTGVSKTRFITVNVSEAPFEIPLSTGWNLISLPVEVVDTSIDVVLGDAHDGDRVYAYEDGTWSSATYYSALPGWYSTTGLTTIEPYKGCWYSATEAYNVTGTGTEPTASSVPIVSGWNLIGYTRLTPRALDDLITEEDGCSDGDRIYAYEDGTWSSATYYSDLPGWYSTTGLTMLDPGMGYWYSASEPFTWEY